jgi:hypothetical protein
MVQFYDCFPDPQIIPTLSGQLTWSHITELLPLKTMEQREYYASLQHMMPEKTTIGCNRVDLRVDNWVKLGDNTGEVD